MDPDPKAVDAPSSQTSQNSTDSQNRRRDPRYDTRAPARVQALTWDLKQNHPAILTNISGRGCRILVQKPFPANTTVRIDVNGTPLIGNVCYCREEPDGYSLGIALTHSVVAMTGISDLLQQLVGHSLQEALPKPAPAAVKKQASGEKD